VPTLHEAEIILQISPKWLIMQLFHVFTCVQVFTLCLYAQCNIGWAGDGRVCGPDRDLDSWPDYDLGCPDSKCRKV